MEVLIYSAPLAETISQSLIFSSSVSRQHSMMTLRSFPPHAALMRTISSSSMSQHLSFTMPRLMTISISSAPFFTASSVSKTLAAVVL